MKENRKQKIFIIDDDEDVRWTLGNILQSEGYEIEECEDSETAMKMLLSSEPDLVLLDKNIPGKTDGITALKMIKEQNPDLPVIILTAYGDLESAVEAIKSGAYDYLDKAFGDEKILITIARALEQHSLSKEIRRLRQCLEDRDRLLETMGTSPEIRNLIKQIQKVARTNFTVVIEGESGTGKELVARFLHQLSDRNTKPFVALDCTTIPETLIESELFGFEKGSFTGAIHGRRGFLEEANGGTFFLDEIGNLPISVQNKLLRTLQEKKIRKLGSRKEISLDIRLITATNVPLETLVTQNRLRQDLFWRINEFRLTIPPLRERQDDIMYLAKRFLDEACRELGKNIKGFTEDALDHLLNYSWPGNIRELRNSIRRAALLADGEITASLLPSDGNNKMFLNPGYSHTQPDESSPRVTANMSLAQAVSEFEANIIRQTLLKTRGNKSQAARMLDIDFKTLQNKIIKYGINIPGRKK